MYTIINNQASSHAVSITIYFVISPYELALQNNFAI